MHNRGYAAAWESFKFPSHMQRVEPGAVILMYAKGIGVIGIGQAQAKCEILKPKAAGRIYNSEQEDDTTEWRVPVRWFAWREDKDAYSWNAPNFTFWSVTDTKYSGFREVVKRHFCGDR